MNTIQGAFSFAQRNKSRTQEAPTPTNISTKSEPAKEKVRWLLRPRLLQAGSFRFPENLPARRPWVSYLPNPGIFLGLFQRTRQFSSTSCLASASPATSLNVILMGTFFKQLGLGLSYAEDASTSHASTTTAAGHEKSVKPIRNAKGESATKWHRSSSAFFVVNGAVKVGVVSFLLQEIT